MVKSGETATFTYNADGLRVKKVCTTTGTTNYTLHGKNVVHLSNGSNNLHFFYDAQNRPAVVVFNGTAYGYVHNLQGDIIAIVNSGGTKVVEYTYDPWGKPLSKTGTLASTLGTLNPFRYRGYVYDEETGCYYLNSRSYAPNQCRFLNSDDKLTASKSAFCYAENSVPNAADPQGTDAIWITSSKYVNSVIQVGHTSLLMEDESDGKWYYTMYAQNLVGCWEVPAPCMDSLVSFNHYYRPSSSSIQKTQCDYDSATYMEGDFSVPLEKIKSMAAKFSGKGGGGWNQEYNLFTNNCVTVSLDMLEMGVTNDGVSMKAWMEEQCKERNIKYPGGFIPADYVQPIAEIFGNTSFTK